METSNSDNGGLAPALMNGLLYAFIVMVAGTLLLSLVLFLTDQTESVLPGYANVVHILALLFGGWTAGRKSAAKGWYAGGMTGILYILIIGLIGFLTYDKAMDFNMLYRTVAAFAAGAFGGIIGVNTSK